MLFDGKNELTPSFLKFSILPAVQEREKLHAWKDSTPAKKSASSQVRIKKRNGSKAGESHRSPTIRHSQTTAPPLSSPIVQTPASATGLPTKRRQSIFNAAKITTTPIATNMAWEVTDMDTVGDENNLATNEDSGFYPIYISECSLNGNNLFEDKRYAIITDNYLHVSKEVRDKKLISIAYSLPLNQILDVQVNNINIGFDWAFPHAVISYHEMLQIHTTTKKFTQKSVTNHISTFILRTSQKSWKLPSILKRALINSSIRHILVKPVYYNNSHVPLYLKLESSLIELGQTDIHCLEPKFLTDIDDKGKIIDRISYLADGNRSVKSAFWTSLNGFKFLFDEITTSLNGVKTFIDEVYHPIQKRSNAKLASIVGLKECFMPQRPKRISELKCLVLISYIRKCILFLTNILFDSEQVDGKMKIFELKRPYSFDDLIKILVEGCTLDSLMRVEFNLPNLCIEEKTLETNARGLASFLNELNPNLIRSESDDTDNFSSDDENSEKKSETRDLKSGDNIVGQKMNSVWSSTPIRNLPRNSKSEKGGSKLIASTNVVVKDTDNDRKSSVNVSILGQVKKIFSGPTVKIGGGKDASENIQYLYTHTGHPKLADKYRSNYQQYHRHKKGSVKGQVRIDEDYEMDHNDDNELFEKKIKKYTSMDIWNSKWAGRNTKSTLTKSSSSAKSRSLNLNQEELEIKVHKLSMSSKSEKRYKGVHFGEMDKTALLELPLPMLPPERGPDYDPWIDEYIQDQELNRSVPINLEEEEPISSKFNGAFPVFQQWESTNIRADTTDKRFENIHQKYKYCVLEISSLLWELNSISHDDIIYQTQYNDHLKACINFEFGSNIRFGPVGVIFDYLIACFHPPIHPSLGWGEAIDNSNSRSEFASTESVDKNTMAWLMNQRPVSQERVILPPKVLVMILRCVLYLDHIIHFLKSKHVDQLAMLRSYWEEELKYLLTDDIIKLALDWDSRPIALHVHRKLTLLLQILK